MPKTKEVPASESSEEKRERLLARRRATESVTPTGGARGRPQGASLSMSTPSSEVPKLLIMGRGQMAGRAMHAMRITPELVERVKKCAAGPLYLVVQVALERLCEQLENQENIQVIKAEDLN